jgi:hypothetical protein
MFNKNGSRGNTSACGSNGLVERERVGMGHKKRGEGRGGKEKGGVCGQRLGNEVGVGVGVGVGA